jgi:hypothetical protein
MHSRKIPLDAALVAILALAGCTPSPPSTQTAVKLAQDAAPLMSLCHTEQSIDASKWPPSFAPSGVKSAYIGLNGLYLETDRVYVQESGVFVPCDSKTFAPESVTGEDPAYVKVQDGVFTYYIAG